MSEPTSEQTEPVKSAPQAPRPADAQNAESPIDPSTTPDQSETLTLAEIEDGKFPHEWWRNRRHDLMADRDSYARVTCGFVLEGRFEQAESTAREFAVYKQLLDEHIQLFRDYQARMGQK